MGRASQYKQKRRFEVELPSGEVFTLRPPHLQTYIASGRMPQVLLKRGLDAWREQGKLEHLDDISTSAMIEDLSQEELTDALVFMRDIVVDCCVDPRIVENPQSEDELSPDDVDDADMQFIFQWGIEKGVETMRLSKFRAGRERGIAFDSTNGADVQHETVTPFAN